MAIISIYNLHLVGAELLNDSESFMNDLSDLELGINGGINLTAFSPYKPSAFCVTTTKPVPELEELVN
jgi:hypothetical protein